MMKRLPVQTLSLFLVGFNMILAGYAQPHPGAPPKIMGALHTLNLSEKPYQPSQNPPELYIHSHWSMGSFTTIEGKTFKQFPLRFDLLGNYLEILIRGNEIKLLPLSQLARFSWIFPKTQTLEKFISEFSLPYYSGNSGAIFEQKYRGKSQLLAFRKVIHIPAYYIPQLDAGNREDSYHVEVNYFLAKKGEGLIPLPRKKKELGNIFSPYEAELLEFMRKEFLTLKREEDLIKLITHFDSLLAGEIIP